MGQRQSYEENQKLFELNKNEVAAYRNVWDAVNAVLRWKFKALISIRDRKKFSNL